MKLIETNGIYAFSPIGENPNWYYGMDYTSGDLLVTLPLSTVEDCYNLLLHTKPLILTRHSNNRFQILWSEEEGKLNIDFKIGERESFYLKENDKLYFSSWWENEEPKYEYFEEVIVRNINGEIIEKYEGSIFEVKMGEYWMLK